MESKIQKKLKTKKDSVVHTSLSKNKDIKYQILKSDLENINFEKTYNKLKRMLSLKVEKANYDILLELIDSVSDNARVAGMMYAGAKETYENYKTVEYAIWWAKTSNLATRILENKKKEKLISGQISEEKIKNWIIENRTEEYEEYTETLNRLKMSVDVMKILYEQWESRKSLLQTQANVIEKRRVIVLDKGRE